ncbi:hypothetical protein HMPREF9318_00068 [Streptococcus urinalis FB127-CNA-2]|uniref:Siphovirus-like protein n=1 Tax=Streptococcus urinalis 2285-97 TaxID=764291 RepID=G5KEH4_9STRE|nr:siphovirus Gp157 family protein [Streptococcus urinalis]QBX22132.1 hypothetical protein Javan637_0024 [Streptococcus phage Javan637]QBX31588.1 hypothetical protein Javan642_0024 [Streptococcus phage Javan642]QBX31667.1 hypothetical protein Javan648_0041 [Streptococcus phage Javan648]EHJ56392.1 siphovirus-like protein [Streptococcus urinalis 2285-97]EKS21870.1 hypothetical protein HMPREF9318_00068 [Streptococcus urinalis FB127-CNA-2]
MSLLYELKGIYEQLELMELDEETFQNTLDSIDFQEDLEDNLDYFAKLLANIEAKIDAYKKAKNDFYNKQKSEEVRKEKIKEKINSIMRMSNKKKIETELFKISTRDTKVVNIIDETKIPLKFMNETIKYTPIKKAIKEAIENGEVIEGAELGQNESVVIK